LPEDRPARPLASVPIVVSGCSGRALVHSYVYRQKFGGTPIVLRTRFFRQIVVDRGLRPLSLELLNKVSVAA
jgi:hypothetical protein